MRPITRADCANQLAKAQLQLRHVRSGADIGGLDVERDCLIDAIQTLSECVEFILGEPPVPGALQIDLNTEEFPPSQTNLVTIGGRRFAITKPIIKRWINGLAEYTIVMTSLDEQQPKEEADE